MILDVARRNPTQIVRLPSLHKLNERLEELVQSLFPGLRLIGKLAVNEFLDHLLGAYILKRQTYRARSIFLSTSAFLISANDFCVTPRDRRT